MGYRINLSNANSIGKLIEGNVMSFLEQTFIDENYFEGNIKYIDDLLSDSNEDFISSNPRRFNLRRIDFNYEWRIVKEIMNSIYNELKENPDKRRLLKYNIRPEILNFFKDLSKLIGGYKYRYLLLPGFEDNEINNLLVSRDQLRRLLTIEVSESYLIIQLKNLPEKNDIQILDSFIHMDKAIERVDEWPAVLVWEKYAWNNTRGIFIPIEDIDDVRSIIDSHNYERNYFSYLQRHYGHRKTKKISQLIHLSDLHLGVEGEETKNLRLIEILKKHRRQTDSEIPMYPIISGDLVDSPTSKNVRLYQSFESQLESIGLANPISVLGNHDVHLKGFIRSNQDGKNILTNLVTRELITVVDKLKLIIVRFNSNIDGKWAQGKIGLDQLADIGNQLDRLVGKDDYYKIALLHHHPFEMERPNWMKKTWYEEILGHLNFDVEMSNILLDATTFIEWLNARNINFIIHGHKHIPKLFKRNDIDVVAGGSSTGKVDHMEDQKTFLTYNLINYDMEQFKPISSTIIFEDLIGSGTKNYQVQIY
ncbi:MAG: metallophosphoesterase [Flavobacteriaceae bacterium]|nr:metallophosphoesterase [Flavobacteriaceae bacterium]